MTARVDPKLVREAWRRFGPLPRDHKLIVDLFAGGGGASLGIEQALGRSPDVAINHDAEAVAMHAANHPSTWHLVSDVWEVSPSAVTAGRAVGLLWASPDCKHFSKAKGGQPVKKRIRALAWIVIKWAREVAPERIILENVEEFATWGPLVQKRSAPPSASEGPARTGQGSADGELAFDLHGSPVMVPCKARKGQTFHRWRRQLERLGYRVEFRERRAFHSGAGTIRKRLYLIATRTGAAIAWPAATHDDPKKNTGLLPWVTAADSIDWSLPCPSIFETAIEIKARHGIRAIRPLKPKTMARIAKGMGRYVLNARSPFIVPITHGGGFGRAYAGDDPLNTLTGAKRGELALVEPFIAGCGGRMGQTEPRSVAEPTQTGTAKEDAVVVAPFVTKFNSGATGYLMSVPHATITAHHSEVHPAGAAPLGMVSAYLVPRYGERVGQEPRARSVETPMPNVVPDGNGASVVAAFVCKNNHGDKPYYAADEPARTFVAGGQHHAVVTAFLAQHNYEEPGHDAREPVSTIVGKGCTQAIVQAEVAASAGVVNLKGSDRRGAAADQPAPTACAQGRHLAHVLAFLTKYHGQGGSHDPQEPLRVVDCNDRVGLVEVAAALPVFGPEHEVRARCVADFLRAHGLWDEREFVTIVVDGVSLVIVDIGMRMLTPRERFRAQGFPDSYVIDLMVAKKIGRKHTRIVMKPLSAEAQGRMVGNSVCPTEARALVAANCNDLVLVRERATA